MNQDILLDTNDDLRIENGDIVIGKSDDQHLSHNFTGDKGSFRVPYIGFGATKYLKGTGNEIRFKRDLKAAFAMDGYRLISIENVNGKVKIEADLI